MLKVAFLIHAAGCLGAWEGVPLVLVPPLLGPWGTPRSVPWGGEIHAVVYVAYILPLL